MTTKISSVLITGGLGFVGRAVVQLLRERHPECPIAVVDMREPTAQEKAIDNAVVYHHGDITDQSSIQEILLKVKPSVVIHTAGLIPAAARRAGLYSLPSFLEINVQGTRNVVAAAREARVKAFVYTSSVEAAKGNSWNDHINRTEASLPFPTRFDTFYSESKASTIYPPAPVTEQHVLKYFKAYAELEVLRKHPTSDMKTAVIRPMALFGPGDESMLPVFQQVLHTPLAKHFLLGKGENMYDVTHVTNAALGHVLAAENLLESLLPASESAHGEVFTITNMQPVRFRDFIRGAWAEWGYASDEWSIDVSPTLAWVTLSGVDALFTLLGGVSSISLGEIGDACAHRWYDCSKAVNILGYTPVVDLVDGLKTSCEYVKRDVARQNPNR